jgi:hypothetical protein
VVEPQRVEPVRRLGLEHDVDVTRQCPEGRRSIRDVQVEHDPALGRVVVPPPQRPVRVDHAFGEGTMAARRVTARRLDDDDIRAQIRK